MGSSHAVSPAFAAAFGERADADGAMPFAEFMELALFHPTLGYYRRETPRVGYGKGTDFYTASTSGAIFGEVVAAACVTLLGGWETASEHSFLEIGSETADGILGGVPHPFASARTVRVGEPLAIQGPCVVFSNELFDAQPLRRFVHRGGAWRELGVAMREGILHEIELPGAVREPWLPAESVEGYVFDAPRAAVRLAARMAEQPWSGLFVAFDYGKSFDELAAATPAGTARAYHRHKQSNDLLADPGEQDLTAHVCWDWLENALREGGFASPALESQEAFFIRHASTFLEKTLAAEAGRMSQRKMALMQLLHPTNMGQKFQVLHARREKA